jgi:hypothetical protein
VRLIKSQSEELLQYEEDDDPADHFDLLDEDGFSVEDYPPLKWRARVDSGEYVEVMAWNIVEAAEEAIALAEVEYPDGYVISVEEAR